MGFVVTFLSVRTFLEFMRFSRWGNYRGPQTKLYKLFRRPVPHNIAAIQEQEGSPDKHKLDNASWTSVTIQPVLYGCDGHATLPQLQTLDSSTSVSVSTCLDLPVWHPHPLHQKNLT